MAENSNHAEHSGPCRVEVVDDDEDIRESMRDLLTDEGYAVTTAANGAEAIDVMADIRPCVVLLDLMMPVMNGWQVVEEMRRRNLHDIPVCVVSAMRDRAPAHVHCVLGKPVNVKKLLLIVEKECRRSQEETPPPA